MKRNHADEKSPKIRKHSWGRIIVEGYNRAFKDVILFPGGAMEWNWNLTGTQHTPGIQIADVEPLVENGSEVVILSRGALGRLKVKNETIEYLKKRNIEVISLQTKEAIKKYNELADETKIGCLIHSTC